MEDQNNAQNLYKCAQIAYETLRVYSPFMFAAANGSWSLALHEMEKWFLDYAKTVIAGDIPETPSLERLWTDPKVTILIVGAIRGMAAALGMQVTYPAVPAHKEMPAFPKRTIDWSTKDSYFSESSTPSFEEAWAKKETEGYQYGRDALEQVRFGWDLHVACVKGERK